MALFIDRNGDRLPYHTLRRIVGAIGRKAGLKEPLTPARLPPQLHQ